MQTNSASLQINYTGRMKTKPKSKIKLETAPEDAAPSVRHKGPLKNEEIKKMLELHLKNRSYEEIAAIVGRSKSTVYRLIREYRPFFKTLKSSEQLKPIRGDILNALEFQVLRSAADEGKHARASLRDIAYTLKEVTNARRLEEGKSTQNADIKIQHTRVPTSLLAPTEAEERDAQTVDITSTE